MTGMQYRIVSFTHTLPHAAECTLRFGSVEAAAEWLAANTSVQVNDRQTVDIVRVHIDARYERPMGARAKLVQTDVTVYIDGWERSSL